MDVVEGMQPGQAEKVAAFMGFEGDQLKQVGKIVHLIRFSLRSISQARFTAGTTLCDHIRVDVDVVVWVTGPPLQARHPAPDLGYTTAAPHGGGGARARGLYAQSTCWISFHFPENCFENGHSLPEPEMPIPQRFVSS